MMWFKIDDGLHAHRKTRALSKSHQTKARDAAPMGLWVLAGSWSAQNMTDGWVPEDELNRWDDEWEDLATRLVRTGWWWPQSRAGEPGYGFNDWLDYNPESETASRSGSFGNHVRWHANKGVIRDDCEHCPKDPDRPESGGDIGGRSGGDTSRAPLKRLKNDKEGTLSDTVELVSQTPSVQSGRKIGCESGGDGGAMSGGDRVATSPSIALPGPARPDPTRKRLKAVAKIAPPRADVERVCRTLVEAITTTGGKPPTITDRWRTNARLMLDADGITETEITACIRWLYASTHRDALFWRANIRGMPKLRGEYHRLRQLAARTTTTSRNAEFQTQQENAMARAIKREQEMGIR